MKTFKLIVILLLAVLVLIVVIQNQVPLQVRFLWLTGDVPGVILLFLTTLAGFIIGFSTALLIRHGKKSHPGIKNG